MNLIVIYISSALSFILGKADSFLIPCPFKYFTHLDCPGCGFQRAFIALMEGKFEQSLSLYPPTIPLLISAFFGLGATFLKWNINSKGLKISYMVTGFIIVINYGCKVLTHQLY